MNNGKMKRIRMKMDEEEIFGDSYIKTIASLGYRVTMKDATLIVEILPDGPELERVFTQDYLTTLKNEEGMQWDISYE